MFIQVIQGRVSDRDEAREAFDQWQRELAPGATGWLGSTAGVTADGELIALARFESADAARENSHRPQQHQWWMETSKLFEGEAKFHDCTEIDTYLEGGSDDAGFVQVIQGSVSDPARARELGRQLDQFRGSRPELLGGMIALHEDGRHFTQSVYFTSEAEAREGERKEMPAEAQPLMDEMRSLTSDLRYLDLTQPWLYSPAG